MPSVFSSEHRAQFAGDGYVIVRGMVPAVRTFLDFLAEHLHGNSTTLPA